MFLPSSRSLAVLALLAARAAEPAWSAKLLVFQLDLVYPNSHFFVMSAVISELAKRNHSILVSRADLTCQPRHMFRSKQRSRVKAFVLKRYYLDELSHHNHCNKWELRSHSTSTVKLVDSP